MAARPSVPDRRDLAAFYSNLSRTGGDVVPFRLGSRQAWLVNHPAHAQHVLERHEGNYGHPTHPYRELGLYASDVGCSLLQVERRGRDRASEKLELAKMLEHEADAAASRLLARRGAVDIADELEPMALRWICRALFDVDVDGRAHAFVRAVDFLEQCMANEWTPGPEDPQAATYARALAVQDETAEWIGRAAKMAGPDDRVPERRRSAILRTVMNGYNATATALTWTLYLLARHRDVQARVHEEPTLLRMVVMESLRLYPPAWILARTAICADQLGDTTIHAGDVVSISPYTMHRLASVWPDPDKFMPERFAAAAMRERADYAYFPFGGGARRCTAASHMIGQLQRALEVMLRRCEFSCDANASVRPRGLIALHPTPAVRLRIRSRD